MIQSIVILPLLTLQGHCLRIDTCVHTILLVIFLYRVANSLLEKVSPQVLSRHCEEVSVWVSGVSGVLDKLGKDALLKLFK